MALPTLDATFASAADLPRRQMLAKWLVNLQYSGSVEDYYTLPEKYLYAKIAVAAGASRSEADYISLPDRYVWSDIYKAVSGSSEQTIDRGEKEALGWIAAAVRGDTADPAKVATYISWPWRYQVASIITSLAVDTDAQSFITASGATDIEGIDQFVKGIKNLNLWSSMVCWPLRSAQNAGTGTTAYSLGGLGTADATLTNGPSWGANGAPFTDSQFASATIPSLSQDLTLLFCGAGDGSTYTQNFPHFFGVQKAGNFSNNAVQLAGNGQATGVNTFHRTSDFAFGGPAGSIASGMSAASAFQFLTGSAKTGTILNVKNIGANTSAANNAAVTSGTATLNRMQINGRWAGSLAFGVPFTCAFCGILTPNISGSESALYNLYRTTLGAGLGLP